MAIELGLSRIRKLLTHLGNPQDKLKVLHVAGTNGKGSVCSLLQSVLQQNAQYAVGKFTSPHLVHITDCISVNSKPISTFDFNTIRARLDSMNSSHQLGCTEFELLTCTALEYFQLQNCNLAILEVGLGGRLDATNCSIGTNKICGITKIGMDHQGFLGNTLEQIAKEKAGIIVPGVQFVAVDGSNAPDVLDVVKRNASLVGATAHLTNATVSSNAIQTKSWGLIDRNAVALNGDYQISNIAVALSMLDYLQQRNEVSITMKQLKDGLSSVSWPGRLQNVEYHEQDHKPIKILIDGAHNGDAAQALAKYIKDYVRQDEEPVTFVLAITQGKDIKPLLDPLLRPGDEVIVTKFGPVDRMPWITAMDPSDLASHVSKYTDKVTVQPTIQEAVQQLKNTGSRPVVVCGSLYLCGELLRDERIKW